MTPTTSQGAFAELMRVHVGPTLRTLGFKGSGGSWTADRPGVLVGLGIQRSVWGDRRETRFTVNLTVASAAAWNEARLSRPHLPARPAPNTRYGSYIWQSRIGTLSPSGEDRWWRLDPQTDLARLAREVTAAIATYALPAIEEQVAAWSDLAER